jgi:acetoin utilization deacetylase AcuC-like enzyme
VTAAHSGGPPFRLKPLLAWASDHFAVSLPEGHPFPMPKYAALRRRLLEAGVLSAEEIHRSEAAPIEWILRAHDAAYVERAFEGTLADDEVRRLGLPWSEALVLRARAAVYGTVMAAAAALEHGVAGNLAGGTHHAFRDRGEGYCLFNDLAVAIHLLRAEGAIRRPFIVDLDVHQGNGTASIFRDDSSVFTFSIHGAGNYPLRKEHSTLDIELPDGCGDEDYLDMLDRSLPGALAEHEPDLVLYQAGVDPLAEDRLGRLRLTHPGLAERDERVLRYCEALGLPVVITLGGGYGQPLEASIEAHVNTWRAARRARDRRPAGKGNP